MLDVQQLGANAKHLHPLSRTKCDLSVIRVIDHIDHILHIFAKFP